jgi:hypothetical protein
MTDKDSTESALYSIEESFTHLQEVKKELAEAQHLLHKASSTIQTIQLLANLEEA